MSTVQDIVTSARYVLNDTDATGYRNSDSELVGYFNEGMREISSIRPDVFTTVGDMVCTVGATEHLMPFSDASQLVRILAIHGGAALTEFDILTMSAFNPGWRTDTAATATQWARYAENPLRFFLYPPAPATTQTLDVMYVKNPTVLSIGSSITEVPVGMLPALVSYVCFMAQRKDDEHSNSASIAVHYQHFLSLVKGG